jgi:hypothetical protein
VKKRRSPQEKKRLSYSKDRRNWYGENDKSSRKNIPRSKRIRHRSERHGQQQQLSAALGAVDESVEAVLAERLAQTRAAALLTGGEVDLVGEPFEQARAGCACFGIERIGQAGDEQGYAHAALPRRDYSGGGTFSGSSPVV